MIDENSRRTPTLRHDLAPFNMLNDEEFELVKQTHSVETYSKNEIIFEEGSDSKGLWLMFSGRVKVFKAGLGGREQIVKLAMTKDFIGYRAVMADDIHTAAAMALEYSQMFFIPKDTIFKLLETNCQIARYIIQSLAVELSFSRYRSVSLSQKQIRGRLAESLLVVRDKYGCRSDNTLKFEISREDLACLSNMTTSNAIRTLSAFVSENIIEVHKREIRILNEPALERISRMG